jgi:hypothetical protein
VFSRLARSIGHYPPAYKQIEKVRAIPLAIDSFAFLILHKGGNPDKTPYLSFFKKVERVAVGNKLF